MTPDLSPLLDLIAQHPKAREAHLRVAYQIIENTLRLAPDFIPGKTAVELLRALMDSGLAQSNDAEAPRSISMLGLAHGGTGGAYAMLRNWQNLARLELARGVAA